MYHISSAQHVIALYSRCWHTSSYWQCSTLTLQKLSA